jgi:spore germination protein KA
MSNTLPEDEDPGKDKKEYQIKISSDLSENLGYLKLIFVRCDDVIFHEFVLENDKPAAIIHIEGMADLGLLDQHVLARLQQFEPGSSLRSVQEHLSVADRKELNTLGEVIQEVMGGNPVLMIDSVAGAVSIGLTKLGQRAVEEPQAESVVRGSRDGFVESITVNTTLIRRRLKTPDLKFVSFIVGRYSKTIIKIGYIEGIAKTEIVEQVSKRISQLDIDGIVESGIVEELIEENNYSPFPQLQSTERPDVSVASLLEGRVVIITENTPVVLIAPTTFWSMLQTPEDYYQRFLIGTLIRWLRYGFIVIALLAPSFYVAVLTFHHEMVPTTLLLRIAKSREEIPFPALLEALIMEITFEALREAGVRLPKQVGSAVSIVGALVIGQAAIQAGIVSAPMVMIVAITGISSFMIPQYPTSIALRMLRFPIMLLSGLVGLYGLIICVLVIICHLCILRSFGVPYLYPVAPMRIGALKDVLIRAPLNKMNRRPKFFASGNLSRQGGNPDDEE